MSKREAGSGVLSSNVEPQVLPSNVEQLTAEDTDDDRGRRVVAESLVLVAVLVALGAIALVLPWPLQRPMWIKAEIVFAVWWIVWAGILAGMLYRGLSLRQRPTYVAGTSSEDKSWGWVGIGLPEVDFGDAEGIVVAITALILLGVLLLVFWLVIEVIAPLLLPLGYAAAWWMLAHVLRTSEHCKGNLMRSVARGAIWASAYTLPLAIGVGLLHMLI